MLRTIDQWQWDQDGVLVIDMCWIVDEGSFIGGRGGWIAHKFGKIPPEWSLQ